jgi:hypothetical protein
MADQGTDRGHSPPRWVRPANHHLGNARGGRQVAVYISFVIVAVRRSTVSPSPVALGEGRRRAHRYLPRAADKRDEGAPFQLIELQRHPTHRGSISNRQSLVSRDPSHIGFDSSRGVLHLWRPCCGVCVPFPISASLTVERRSAGAQLTAGFLRKCLDCL